MSSIACRVAFEFHSTGAPVENNNGTNRDLGYQFEGDDASPRPFGNILESEIENRTFNSFGQMAIAITELNKFLNEERDKREKLFQENLELKFEIESLRSVDHVAISKAIVSEGSKTMGAPIVAKTVDCLGNNRCPDPCSRQMDKQHEKQHGEKNRKISQQRKRRRERRRASKEKRLIMMQILHRQRKKQPIHRLLIE